MSSQSAPLPAARQTSKGSKGALSATLPSLDLPLPPISVPSMIREEVRDELRLFMKDLRAELYEWSATIQQSTAEEVQKVNRPSLVFPDAAVSSLREAADQAISCSRPSTRESIHAKRSSKRKTTKIRQKSLVYSQADEAEEDMFGGVDSMTRIYGSETQSLESPDSFVVGSFAEEVQGKAEVTNVPGTASHSSGESAATNSTHSLGTAEPGATKERNRRKDRGSASFSPHVETIEVISTRSDGGSGGEDEEVDPVPSVSGGRSSLFRGSTVTTLTSKSSQGVQRGRTQTISTHAKGRELQSRNPQIKRMPSRFNSWRRKALGFVNHSGFDVGVAIAILLNGVVVGSQTDYMARHTLADSPLVFEILEYIFCVIFTAELSIRIFAYRYHFFTGSTGVGWNLFDFAVVTCQLAEILLTFVADGLGYSFNLLRTLRLVRVLRLARTLRLIGQLRIIVYSIAQSFKPLLWTGVLLFMIVYVLSVYVTTVVLHERRSLQDRNEPVPSELDLYWGSLVPSMYSLFQSITGGIDWEQVSRPLITSIGPEVAVLFTLYIMFTVFAMLNVVTGVFIQNVIKNETAEREWSSTRRVQDLFQKIDWEADTITWEEFEEQLDTKAMQEFFKEIDVDIKNARALFELLDADGSGCLDADEFMDGCLRIWAPSKGMDLRILMRDLNQVKGLVLAGFQRDHPSIHSRPSTDPGRHDGSRIDEDWRIAKSDGVSLEHGVSQKALAEAAHHGEGGSHIPVIGSHRSSVSRLSGPQVVSGW